METLIQELKKRNLTIGSCESLTAGLFCSEIAAVPGASSVLKGGIITYQTSCKERVVHVPHELIETYGVLSKPCVEAMAKNAKELLDCDICVSFSGNAGPDCMEEKTAGTVFCGLAIGDEVRSYECHFQGARNDIRQLCITFMRDTIIEVLKEREDNAWKNK